MSSDCLASSLLITWLHHTPVPTSHQPTVACALHTCTSSPNQPVTEYTSSFPALCVMPWPSCLGSLFLSASPAFWYFCWVLGSWLDLFVLTVKITIDQIATIHLPHSEHVALWGPFLLVSHPCGYFKTWVKGKKKSVAMDTVEQKYLKLIFFFLCVIWAV